MKLYYFETPNGRKPCAVAKYLNSPVEFERVDLAQGAQKAPDYLAINPNGRIPALVDGDTALWESQAIMCYLARKAGSDLWPNDDRQVDIIRWFNWDTAHFSRHAGGLVWENVIKPNFGLGEPNPAAIKEATMLFRQFAGVLDAHLAARTYLVGDKLSLADFSVAAFLPYASPAQIPLNDFAHVKRWHDAMMEMPAWREPFPVLSQSKE